VSAFAFLSMPPVERESHLRLRTILASLHAIARRQTEFSVSY
jgi:hypothetical protein